VKKHLLPLALLLLLLAAPARAEDGEEEMRPRVLEMSRATVLASPGTPSALESFLPRGAKPERLTWPLPTKGSLLVLGLPGSDPVARRIADLFQFDVGPDALAGGYAVRAWQDGRRNLVFVFGADAAALQAARFEFNASAPVEMMDPNVRSLDFKKPNQEAGVLVRAGNRLVRPRYRMRALAPGRSLPVGIATAISGARGNRLWIDHDTDDTSAQRAVRRARDHGIEPVLVLRMTGDPRTAVLSQELGQFDWSKDEALVRFALVMETPLEVVRSCGTRYAAVEAEYIQTIATWLRGTRKLAELVVVPRCHSDRLAKVYGPPPDLRDIPEAVIAWSGPLEHSATIMREQAERRVKEAGIPVVLLDTWAAPFRKTPVRDLYIPSLPTRRAPDLGDVLAGVVVVGSRGTEALLESAWDPKAKERFGLDLLTELVPRDEKDPLEVARVSAVRLDHAAKENLGLVPWMAPLAAELRRVKGPIERIPLVDTPLRNDGRVDEKAWTSALHVPETPRGVDLLVLSDGSTLHVALRIDRVAIGRAKFRIDLKIDTRGRCEPWRFEITEDNFSFERPRETERDVEAVGVVQLSRRTGPDPDEIEITLDRFALGGDAHELRSFDIDLSLPPRDALPPPFRKAATLIVLK